MEVILLQDVKGLGTRGQIVRVSDGYARNSLIPKGLAKFATKQTKKVVENQIKSQKKTDERKNKQAQSLVQKIEKTTLEMTASANDNEVLYAALKENEIIAKLKEVDFKLPGTAKIISGTPIKDLGLHEVGVEVVPGTKAILKVNLKSGDG